MNKPQAVQEIAQGLSRSRLAMGSVANATMVNRTHRVVRERALVLADARNRRRSLWIPVAICSSLVLMLCTALWRVFTNWEEATESATSGIPDASHQIFLLLLWSLPLSGMLMALAVFRRRGGHASDDWRDE